MTSRVVTDDDYSEACLMIREAQAIDDPLARLVEIGFSVKEIAKEIGVSERTVWRWKSGDSSRSDSQENLLVKLIVWNMTQTKAIERTLLARGVRVVSDTSSANVSYGQVWAAADVAKNLKRFAAVPANREYAEKQRRILAEATGDVFSSIERRLTS